MFAVLLLLCLNAALVYDMARMCETCEECSWYHSTFLVQFAALTLGDKVVLCVYYCFHRISAAVQPTARPSPPLLVATRLKQQQQTNKQTNHQLTAVR